jgi:DNA primase
VKTSVERIPEEFIQRIKSSVSIVSLFEKYAALKRAGRDYVCLCPFHSEKTPSCHIYSENESFYCFGCGAGGDVINFVRLIENLDYVEAIKEVAGYAGMTVPETDGQGRYSDGQNKARVLEMNRTAAKFWVQELLRNNVPQVYLTNRGLTPDTVKKYGIGWAADSWNTLQNYMRGKGYHDDELTAGSLLTKNEKGNCYDKFRGRIMFPIIDRRGNVIGFGGRTTLPDGEPKYLNSSETAAFQKRNNLFSLNFAKNTAKNYFILCEGYMDAVSMNQAGFDNAVAALGTAITDSQARLIKQYVNEAVIACDADEAGQKATFKAVNLLSEAGIAAKVLQISDAKDPDEYIKKFGGESFEQLINKSSSALSFSLGKLKNTISTSTQEGRTEFLKKAVDILAEIENKVDRTIYISDVARECQIAGSAVETAVNDKIIRNKRKGNKSYEKTILLGNTKRDEITPEEKDHLKESRAEKRIIAYLIHSPDMIDLILSRLSDEYFIVEFHRKVFNAVIKQLIKGNIADISTLGAEFSPQEVGRITKITVEAKELPFTKEGLMYEMDILEQCKEKREEKIDTTEDLIEYQKKMQKKLQKK